MKFIKNGYFWQFAYSLNKRNTSLILPKRDRKHNTSFINWLGGGPPRRRKKYEKMTFLELAKKIIEEEKKHYQLRKYGNWQRVRVTIKM